MSLNYRYEEGLRPSLHVLLFTFSNYPEKGVLSPQCRVLIKFMLISCIVKPFIVLHVSFTRS